MKIGYEISFNRYFYKPEPMRTLEEIRAEITAVERESEGLLGELLPGVRSTVAAPASWGIGGLAVREPPPGAAKLRVYIDTSVIGGCLDEEFEGPSRRLIERCARGEITLVISEVTSRELAPRPPGRARYSDVHRPGPFGRDRDHARGREPGEPVH